MHVDGDRKLPLFLLCFLKQAVENNYLQVDGTYTRLQIQGQQWGWRKTICIRLKGLHHRDSWND